MDKSKPAPAYGFYISFIH